MVRVVVSREPEWDAEQVALFQAHRQVEAERGPYGIPLSRATDPTAKFEASDKPTMNLAVEAGRKARDAYFKQYPEAQAMSESLMWSVSEVTE